LCCIFQRIVSRKDSAGLPQLPKKSTFYFFSLAPYSLFCLEVMLATRETLTSRQDIPKSVYKGIGSQSKSPLEHFLDQFVWQSYFSSKSGMVGSGTRTFVFDSAVAPFDDAVHSIACKKNDLCRKECIRKVDFEDEFE